MQAAYPYFKGFVCRWRNRQAAGRPADGAAGWSPWFRAL